MKQPRKMAKPFTDLVGEIENGQFLGDLTEAMHNIVAAVMDTRKPGRLTIKLAMTPTGRGTVDLKADFDAKNSAAAGAAGAAATRTTTTIGPTLMARRCCSSRRSRATGGRKVRRRDLYLA